MLIYLIGSRASGKSTIGKMLAERLILPFFDLDHCLAREQGKAIGEIVAQCGWGHFRNLESATLRKISGEAGGSAVLATGGGIVLAPENRAFMAANGLVVWLKASQAVLHGRLCSEPLAEQRPALTDKGLLAEIGEVLREREPLYASCATHVVDAAGERASICEAICGLLADAK